jgi:hypothetical protein
MASVLNSLAVAMSAYRSRRSLMPVLREKADGTYCVRKHFDGCKTWQINGSGVRWLRSKGVTLPMSSHQRNVRFSHELFFEALRLGLVYIWRLPVHPCVRECSRCGGWSDEPRRRVHGGHCTRQSSRGPGGNPSPDTRGWLVGLVLQW